MNFYEQIFSRGRATGEGMTHFERLFAAKFGGSPPPEVREYTGAVPVTITADGTPLLDYLITGNTVQTGTPTPDNPIMSEGCGEMTGNLLNLNRTYSNSFTTDTTKWMNGAATVNNAGTVYAETEIIGDTIKVTSKNSGYGASFLIKASPNTTYTVSFETDKVSSGSWGGISDRDINGTVINYSTIQGKSATFTTHDNCAFLNVCFRFPLADGTVTFSKIMLNKGSTPLTSEPYGIKIPMSSAGQTNNIYLGEVQTTRKIIKYEFNGSEAWTKNSASATEYRYYLAGLKEGLTRIDMLCSHLPIATSGVSPTIAGVQLFSNRTTLLINVGTDVMNAQPSGNTIAGLKEYLAAQYAAGTPVTVWYVLATEETGIVNEPLMRIGDYADTVSKAQAGVAIPTNNGSTTVDVDTELKPSEVYIKYMG